MRRILNIVLMLAATTLMFAGIAHQPGVRAQQTVAPAAQPLVAYPKPATLMSGYDTYCSPYFLRSTISGKDRVGFAVGSQSNQPDPLFADIKVVRGTGAVPTARPLDGNWDNAQHWEIAISPGDYDQSAKCLPPLPAQ